MAYTGLIDKYHSWHSWPFFKKKTIFFTTHGLWCTSPAFKLPHLGSAGSKSVWQLCCFLCLLVKCFFFDWLQLEVAHQSRRHSWLFSWVFFFFFSTIPTDCSIEWLQWQTRLTSDWLMGGQEHTSGVPPGGWFLLSLFPFLNLSLILSRLRLPDCV